tara:strand:- start:54 stop:1007 length:954 start_codon:yes stop_codon:yes gene_type:complete
MQPTSEQSILERIKVSRGGPEPIAAPTENHEVVNVSEDAPEEDAVEPEASANEEVAPEAEESEQEEDEQATPESEDEDLYVDYKGREINLKDVEKWEQGHLRQSDYTRKTQELADNRKDFEDMQTSFTAKESELNDKLLTLEAMLKEDTKTADEIAEMREYEPEEYIKYTEKQSKLKEFVSSAKTASQPVSVDMAKVSSDLFASHPDWMKDGKQTQKFTDDTTLMTKYAEQRGISQADMSTFEAKHYEVMLDAARYKSQSASNAAIEKKVRKAPVSTRPRAAAKGELSSIDKAQKAFNQNPSVQNAAMLRTAKRQIN